MTRAPVGIPSSPLHDRPEAGVPFLQIARMRFVRVGSRPQPLFAADYGRFLDPLPSMPGTVQIPVEFRLDEAIARPPGLLFTTGGAWSMARQDGEYLLSIGPREPQGEVDILLRFAPGEPPAVTASFRGIDANPLAYPADQVLLMYLLAARGGAIFHAAGFGLRGCGLAFLGRSGAGKTTLSRLLLGRPGWEPLSDDRVIVRRIGERHLLFGTPWPGEAGLAESGCHPLGGLCFLRQGRENRLEALQPRAAMERLLPIGSVPWFDREAMEPLLDFLGGLAAAVPAWDLEFRNDASVAEFLEDCLPRQGSSEASPTGGAGTAPGGTRAEPAAPGGLARC